MVRLRAPGPARALLCPYRYFKTTILTATAGLVLSASVIPLADDSLPIWHGFRAKVGTPVAGFRILSISAQSQNAKLLT